MALKTLPPLGNILGNLTLVHWGVCVCVCAYSGQWYDHDCVTFYCHTSVFHCGCAYCECTHYTCSMQAPLQHEQEHEIFFQNTSTWHSFCKEWDLDMEEHVSLCDCSCVQFRPADIVSSTLFPLILIKWLSIPKDMVDTRTVYEKMEE